MSFNGNPNNNEQISDRGTRWQRRGTGSTPLCTDMSGIHLQTQKCVEDTLRADRRNWPEKNIQTQEELGRMKELGEKQEC